MSVTRALDVSLVVVAAPVAAPVVTIAAIAVWLIDGRPVFFRQPRVGRGGRTFELVKLRTMRPDGRRLAVTVAGDPRITPLGRLLRRSKLDELPQLLNVLHGDMSLVGYRPEIPEFSDVLATFPYTTFVRPGLTDLASIVFFDEARYLASRTALFAGDLDQSYREHLVAKLRISGRYAEAPSVGTYFRTLALTALALIAPRWASTAASRWAS